MNRATLLENLDKYKTIDKRENSFISRFRELLLFEDCFYRTRKTGHITASAWVLNIELDKVLLLHHKKLNRWLQPGGHADGDEVLLQVAKKELEEETGIITTETLNSRHADFFDLDIHTIPARNDEPEHEHFDVRFAFVALSLQELQGNNESKDLRWVDLDKIEALVGTERSILRMRDKTYK